MKYSDSIITQAIQLRKKERYSFADLHRLTGIPATTIRNWCKDDVLGTRWDTLLINNERRRQELKISEAPLFETLVHTAPHEKLYAALLYWCEGSKYPSSKRVEFTNSDPQLVKLFLQLLRRSFQLDESRLRVHLQLHDIHNSSETNQYWSQLLDVPVSQFIKPIITKMRGGKHRREYKGTCTIRYPDYRIQLKLIGMYEEFARRFR